MLIGVAGVLGLLHDSWPSRRRRSGSTCMHSPGSWSWGCSSRASAGAAGTRPAAAARLRRARAPPFDPVHVLLYVLMFVIPILGIVTFIWHGRVFDFGLLRLDFGVPKNRAVFQPTELIHGYLAYALFGLATLHALAALWHQYVRRDGMLWRMWPRAREPQVRVQPPRPEPARAVGARCRLLACDRGVQVE